MTGPELADAVRAAAARHETSWAALVPDSSTVNFAAEAAEDAAWEDMATAKRALRDHICEAYGISPRELASLATIA